jgi:ribosomal protein S21
MSLAVYLRDGESQESLLQRFQKAVQISGVLREFRTHRHFVSKGEADRIKVKNSARKRRRQSYQQNKYSK